MFCRAAHVFHKEVAKLIGHSARVTAVLLCATHVFRKTACDYDEYEDTLQLEQDMAAKRAKNQIDAAFHKSCRHQPECYDRLDDCWLRSLKMKPEIQRFLSLVKSEKYNPCILLVGGRESGKEVFAKHLALESGMKQVFIGSAEAALSSELPLRIAVEESASRSTEFDFVFFLPDNIDLATREGLLRTHSRPFCYRLQRLPKAVEFERLTWQTKNYPYNRLIRLPRCAAWRASLLGKEEIDHDDFANCVRYGIQN